MVKPADTGSSVRLPSAAIAGGAADIVLLPDGIAIAIKLLLPAPGAEALAFLGRPKPWRCHRAPSARALDTGVVV